MTSCCPRRSPSSSCCVDDLRRADGRHQVGQSRRRMRFKAYSFLRHRQRARKLFPKRFQPEKSSRTTSAKLIREPAFHLSHASTDPGYFPGTSLNPLHFLELKPSSRPPTTIAPMPAHIGTFTVSFSLTENSIGPSFTSWVALVNIVLIISLV